MSGKKIVAFYNKGSKKEHIVEWEKKIKKWYSNFNLVPLDFEEAAKAEIVMVWKPPMKKILSLKYLTSIICLGQGVDHIIHNSQIPSNVSVYRIVDPYMAKSMSHWVILSILNYVRDYDGYKDQQKKRIYKSREIIDFKSVKIGIYGLGEIGFTVANDLSKLGFKVLGWSRTKKNKDNFDTYNGEEGFKFLLSNSDIHVCLFYL